MVSPQHQHQQVGGILLARSHLPSPNEEKAHKINNTLYCTMVYFSNATLRFDGACQPNPGEGGAGYIIFNDKNGNNILEGRDYIGWYYEGYECTNNIAEYWGLIKGLQALEDSPHSIGHLSIEGDSKLVINQMDRVWNVNSDVLYPMWDRAQYLINSSLRHNVFDTFSFDHIYRGRNTEADKYARDAVRKETSRSYDNY